MSEQRSIDAVSVAQFFLHEFVPSPRSILANVRKLAPGTLLRWTDGGGLSAAPYYVPSRVRPGLIRAPARELAGELVRRVEDATRARLVADVPVGVFLSGGLDSSFLAACAARIHPRVKTFTVGFDDASFDESSHARVVAQHLRTEHVEHHLSTRALLDLLPDTLSWMDEPLADSSLLPTTLLARAARHEVTVALGGEGGDELLAGYPTFVVDQALGRLPAISATMARMARGAGRLVPVGTGNFSASFKTRQFLQGIRRPRSAPPRVLACGAAAEGSPLHRRPEAPDRRCRQGVRRDGGMRSWFVVGVRCGDGVLPARLPRGRCTDEGRPRDDARFPRVARAAA